MEAQDVEKWKTEGNKHFVAKKYLEAIRSYTKGLSHFAEHLDLLSNRSAAYIKLGYFYRAIDDANDVLVIDPTHLKAVYRKARALSGLKKYKEAINFIGNKTSFIEELMNSKDIINLLKKIQTLELQRCNGKYDIMKLFQQELLHEDYADYDEPVEIANIPGKGRGLIANRNILAGRDVIVSKAFAIFYSQNSGAFSFNHLKDYHFRADGYEELSNLVTEKLTMEPEHGKDIYSLYAGPQMPFFEGIDNQNIPVDKARIKAIVKYCSIGGQMNPFSGGRYDIPVPDLKKIVSRGLWILPSYLNHSCLDCNCFIAVYDDIMVIRSFKNIEKGEEILVPYILPTETYFKRQVVFNLHEFVCSCRLCERDRKDNKKYHEKREHLLSKIQLNWSNNSKLRSLTKELEDLRSDTPELALYAWIYHQMISQDFVYAPNPDHETTASGIASAIRAYELMTNSPMVPRAVECATGVLYCVLRANDIVTGRKWIDILKRDLMIAYGSLDMAEFVSYHLLVVLNELKIPFKE